jgi:ABC-type lipoprotein release transport system permease subunit
LRAPHTEFDVTALFKIAWRNVWRQRRKTVLIAVAMGVIMSLLVFYDGLFIGFEQAIYGNAIRFMGGNVQVHAPGYNVETGRMPLLALENPDAVVQAAEAHPDVVSASKRINTGGMVSNREGAFSVTFVGLEPEKEAVINPVAQNISAGRFLSPGDGDRVVIGQGLATAMEVDVGDRIVMVAHTKHEQTRQRTVTVIGIYDVGVPMIEKDRIYMSLDEAQRLLGLDGQATEVVVTLRQIGQETAVVQALHTTQPGYEVDTWVTGMPEFKKAMDMDKSVMALFGYVMLGIAAIGILNLLMMAVFERTREIGVLSALGLKPAQVMTLFLLEGLLVGVMGAVIGALLGTMLNSLFSYVGIDYSQFADMTEYTALISDKIYSQLVPLKVLQHALTVTVIAAIAAFYPARQASRREPAEALHYV